jgi:hypothetical protein
MYDVNDWEAQVSGAWAAYGQQGGGGSPAPSNQANEELGIGALGLLVLGLLATGYADRFLKGLGA